MNLSLFARRLTAAGISALMLVGNISPVSYQVNAEEPGEDSARVTEGITWEKVEDSSVKGLEKAHKVEEELTEAGLIKDGNVRVSIVVDGDSTVEAGYSAQAVATNDGAKAYRAQVLNNQKALEAKISAEALNGEALDVVWNITLAGNIISANVPYVRIEQIKKVAGVKDVVIENRYEAAEPVPVSDPEMAVASDMTGTSLISSDYTGAGQAIAVIDTGIDTDHRSFDAESFDHAIESLEGDVDLIDEADVAAVFDELNVSQRAQGITAADTYLSTKIPFAFNYVDSDLDVTHDNDTQSEHGSHVSGIAAANRYVKNAEGEFVEALDEVKTQGQAPDAQILAMKVFGKGGGAYDSDYFAAIEDAMVLGAASANLSLGSANPGLSFNSTYADILNRITEEDTVVTISAGNSYSWPTSAGVGFLYSDDVSLATGGSPGSYTNAFTVASVNNDGMIGTPIKVDGTSIFFSDGSSANNVPLASMPGEYGYIAIDGAGTAEEMAALAGVLEGKIAVVSRGSTSFFEKANAAVENGAVATIIYNNQAGTISMNLTGYLYANPAVSITRADGNLLKAKAEAKTTEDGAAYYEGTLTILETAEVQKNNSDYYTMSDFSSWGTTGDLNLKPEITAPGGNIYSVNGLVPGGQAYELMSGTSMAAPEIAGITALMHQYIAENGLVEKTGLTEHQLTISLLMSTAEPVIEKDTDYYYSVLKQGAGLANVAKASSAKSYVLVQGTTTGGEAVDKQAYTQSYADGKVKAMLGEDADRTGLYTATYTVTNFSDEETVYGFGADIFTQDIFPYQNAELLDTWTLPLEAIVTYTVNGEPLEADGLDFNGDGVYDAYDPQALLEYVVGTRESISHEDKADIDEDGDIDTYDAYLALNPYNNATVKLAAGETMSVTASIDLNGALDEIGNEDRNGAYVEGYLFVAEGTTAEGVNGVEHSIPVLGYFGSWSEPSMTDKGSYLEFMYGEETRQPYMATPLGMNGFYTEAFGVKYAGENGTYFFGGNPYTTDETYHPERNAINAKDSISEIMYSQIRNSGAARFIAEDKDGNVLAEQLFGPAYSAYYHVNQGKWMGTTSKVSIGYSPADVKEGDQIHLTYTMAPEYYIEGDIDWETLSANDSMQIEAVIDNTAPEFEGDEPVALIYDEEAERYTAIEVTVKDNQYLAAAYLMGETAGGIGAFYAEEDAKAGETKTYRFELEEDVEDHLYLNICDYAANETIYKINLNQEELQGDVAVTIDPEEINVLKNSSIKANATVSPWGVDEAVTWTSADETIATVDETGLVKGISEGTTTITATSVLEPNASATAVVNVKTFDIPLNGVVWDESGEVWFSEFNTNSLPDYTKLSDSMRLGLASVTYDQNGKMYAASFDSDEMLSTLYEINEADYTAEAIGDAPIGYMDLCKAPSMGDNLLFAVYGPYVVLVDKTTGNYAGVFDVSETIGTNYLTGIAFEEQYAHPDYGNTDWIWLIDNAGTLYEAGYVAMDGSYFTFGVKALGQIADAVDVPYFQSLYYDGANLFYSRFNEADNKVELVMVEDIYNVGEVWSVGHFADGVWPVGGLYEKGVYNIGIPAEEDPDKAAAVITASADTHVEKIVPARTVAKGGLNTELGEADDKAESIRKEQASVNGAGEASNAKVIPVTTDTEATNGLYTVTYDPAEVELLGAKGTTKYNAINTAEEGKVIVGFINAEALAEGSDVAELTFRTVDPAGSGEIEVTTNEENNEKSENTETVEISGDALVATGTMQIRITGDDWGAGVDRAIIKLDRAVDGSYITGGLFEVTQAVNGGEAAERTVLDAYTSDAEGNKVAGESEYITIDLRISPVEGSPIVWSMQTWTNSWADPYELNVDLKEGAKLFAGEEQITVLEIENEFDVADVNNENVLIPQLEGYEYSTFEASDGLVIPYGLYTPANADDGNKHALVIWNHGVGERGSDPRIAILGNEVTALNGEEFQELFDGAYILVPQTPANTAGKDIVAGKLEMVEAFTADETLAIDADRVIVGGCSMGGGQTMNMIYKKPNLFAAAYPVCPASNSAQVTDEQIEKISRLPIWFTHCVNDNTVNYAGTSEALIERLQAAGNENVHWSIFDDVHDTTGRFNDLTEDGSDYQYATHWSWVYFDNNECFCDDENCDNLNEWEWLAAQRRVPFLFDDVQDPERFYYEPVYWAYYHDPQITKGTSRTLFSPDQTCTRAQIVTFLWRMMGQPEVEYDMQFTDVTEDRYFYKAVAWAASEGITTGTSKTKFSPDDSCTRGQIVTFLWRAMGSPEPETTASFDDVAEGKYFYKAVSWAAENDITKGTSATKFSPDNKCTRGQAVTFLYRTAHLDE